MRARYPDCDGTVVRDGVEIRYARYGQGSPAILLLPTWALVPSRHWKMQVPHLARHFTVVCLDGWGSGGSGRPPEPGAYTDVQFASDALAVMDAAGLENFHVRHRLDRYGGGTCLDYATSDPDLVAARGELAGKPVSYRDVETDGAARAAQLTAELV